MAVVGPLIKLLGIDFTATHTVQKHPLGAKILATDGREYTYVKASAAISATEAVVFGAAYAATKTPATADISWHGVAHVAIASGSYGWVVTRGIVNVLAAATVVALAPAVPIATAGTLDDTAGSTANALAMASGAGAIFLSTTTAGVASVLLR